MEKKKIIYVYDAHCSWCYAFSGEMKKLHNKYQNQLDFEVISGGMVVGDRVGLVKDMMPTKNLLAIYDRIMQMTGTAFGKDYLAKVEKGEVYVNSEIPAIALSVFKSYNKDQVVDFAHQLQHQLFVEAKSVNDENIYRDLATEFGVDGEEFIEKMKSDTYREAARYDFALGRQLQVTGYPQVLVQVGETQFYLIAKGWTDFGTLEGRLNQVLAGA